MAEPRKRVSVEDFDAFVEFLSEREGKAVYVEIGTKDPETDRPGDAVALRSWMILGGVEPAHDTDRDRLMVMVRLPQLGADQSCLYFDPQRITEIKLFRGDVARVIFLDSFYVGFSGAIEPGREDDDLS